MAFPFTITQDSITIIFNGRVITVQKGAPNFLALRTAILKEEWDTAIQHLTIKQSLTSWARGLFTMENDRVLYNKQPVPEQLNQRILAMAAAGDSPEPMLLFWEKLQKNPSMRSVEQLYPFLQHQGIPITKDGNFLAYKGITSEYRDAHTGTIDNSPGTSHEMPRNQISDDPQHACHFGFHVGALQYARGFSDIVVVCEVDPTDVVCIPYDCDQHKMRVCKYKVIGNHNGEYLPSTSFTEDDEEYNEEYDEEHDEDEELTEAEAQCLEPTCPDAVTMPYHDHGGLGEPHVIVEDTETLKQKAPKLKAKGRKWRQDSMDALKLMKESLDMLRAYAGKRLQITGASKIPGGKAVLVAQIIKVRNQQQRKNKQ